MCTHPFTLPEIVLTIGKFIPLWVPEQLQETTLWGFKPKNLAAAISVNRLFYTLLSPILWSTFAYPICRSYRGIDTWFYDPSRFLIINAETITKNSLHIRYLDFTQYSLHMTRSSFKLAQLQLNCTQLQELRLSYAVPISWATQLIYANPGLRLLRWTQSLPRYQSTSPSNLKSLNSLHQLRSLQLVGWRLHPIALYHVLDHNANSLEDLEFGYLTTLVDQPCMNNEWSGLTASSLDKMTSKEVAAATKDIQGRPLLLPKLKKFTLYLMGTEPSNTICSLVRAFPSLESIVTRYTDHRSVLRLAKTLQEFCPNLRSIRDEALCAPRSTLSDPDGITPSGQDAIINVINACAPGTLAHINLNRSEFNTNLANTLLKYRDGIESFELTLQGVGNKGALRNVFQVLDGCCDRLKQFSLTDKTQYSQGEATEILEVLRRCQRLESLKLVLFPQPEPHEGIDETPAHVFQLPPGWRQIEVTHIHDSPAHLSLTNAFKSFAFEAIADLPAIQKFDLNHLRFERVSSISFE
ncbi:hypothetical protein EC991_005841 [Linnemannia zychae]|nr:hypothetical protein EC991_005841 [Linnemannia zychae]